MGAEIKNVSGRILTIGVSGLLTQPELKGVQAAASIERMAIVGERKWEDLVMLFTAKGLRPFPIEYFEPAKLAAAHAWLAAT